MVEGSCLCGKIRYEVEVIPEQVFNCHCKFCRKAHGADYATLVVAKASTLKLMDEKGLLTEHQNDLGGFRAFCAECGTRLMNYAPDKTDYFSVTLATIDTPINFKPVAHANTESKAAWCTPYDGIPQFSGFPDGL